MKDHWPIVEHKIEQTISDHLPYGGGPMTDVRLRSALDVVAKTAWREAEAQVLLNLLTVEDVAEQLGISPRRVRAIAAHRHERFGIGWKVPGTRGTWLFRPEELDSLRPGLPGNPNWKRDV